MNKLPSLLNAATDKDLTFFRGALIPADNDFVLGSGYPLQEFLGDRHFEVIGLDAFGDLFIGFEGGVARFLTEFGGVDETWCSVEKWLMELKNDPDAMVGQGFLLDWENKNGKLKSSHRLTPKMPFIFGGNYELGNIVSIAIPEILSFRADIARQIRDLPDGSRVMIDTI